MELKGIQLLTLCLAVCISLGDARAAKKIVRGQSAAEAEFPYQVSVWVSNQFFCGGSIIHAKYILTAAHCVYKNNTRIPPWSIAVITGIIDIGKPAHRDDIFGVSGVLPHLGYDNTKKVSAFADIALLKLRKPITFNPHRRAIRLPTFPTHPSTQAIASGWGASVWSNNSESQRWLQKLPMTTVDLNECGNIHGWYGLNDGNICAIGNVQSSGICQGDSGGPLVANGQLIGITSWAYKCGAGRPDVFTSVHYFKQWILEVVSATYHIDFYFRMEAGQSPDF